MAYNKDGIADKYNSHQEVENLKNMREKQAAEEAIAIAQRQAALEKLGDTNPSGVFSRAQQEELNRLLSKEQ